MVDLSLAAHLSAPPRGGPAQWAESCANPRLMVDGEAQVDAAALQRIGIAFGAVAAMVTALAFIAVASN
ncbi:MAG: hypothetical protein JO000_26790 [Alphaproteobacteria bacterium]|nr:hypothetical protein [Alphaproteobacteria bacterium]